MMGRNISRQFLGKETGDMQGIHEKTTGSYGGLHTPVGRDDTKVLKTRCSNNASKALIQRG